MLRLIEEILFFLVADILVALALWQPPDWGGSRRVWYEDATEALGDVQWAN